MATVMKTTPRRPWHRAVRSRAATRRRRSPARPSTSATCRLPGMLKARLLRSPHAHAQDQEASTSARRRRCRASAPILTAADIPELQAEREDARPRDHGDRPGGVLRPAGGGRRGRRAGDRRRGARPDRGRVRGAAGRRRPDQVDAARRAAGRRRGHRGRHQRGAGPLGHRADRERDGQNAPNVAQKSNLGRGDVAAAIAEADFILEKTYHVPMVHQGYIEAHAAVADYDRAPADDGLGEHAGLVQHALRDRGRPAHPRGATSR